MTSARVILALSALLLTPAAAAAQGPVSPVTVEAMPWLVADIRGSWPSIGNDGQTAEAIGRVSTDLPGRALAAGVGVHVYPIRRGRLKWGVGVELLRGRGSYQQKDADGEPVGSEINRTLDAVSGQVSLNFGRGQGWSYVTAGAGPFAFDTYLDDGPGDGEKATAINFGGGARWFKWPHLGISADMRFYLSPASAGTATTARRGSQRIVVLSIGLTVK